MKIGRYCKTTILIGLWLLAGVPQGRAQAPVEVIVRFAPGMGKQGEGREGLRASGTSEALLATVQEALPLAPAALGGTYVLRAATPEDAARLVATLGASPGVRYAQLNHRYTLDRAGDGPLRYDSLAHLVTTGVPAAHAITTGLARVRVGVVDTGVLFGHPALSGQFWVNPAEDLNHNGRLDPADLNGKDDDGNGLVDDVSGYDFVDRPTYVLTSGDVRQRDPDASEDLQGAGRGHGTSVAAVIAGRVVPDSGFASVAPGVRLVPLRACSGDGSCDDDDVAAAIVYAADLGLDVLNLSFGDTYASLLLRDAIAYAVGKGVTVVASAGNDGTDRPHYPSDFEDVISVQWLSADGQSRGAFATRGVGVDLGAPATGTYTARLPDFDGTQFRGPYFGRASGSSLAAPLVSGAVALLRSFDPSLTPAGLRSILTATTDDLGAPGWDATFGAGLLRIDRALARVLPGRVAITAPAADGAVSAAVVEVRGSALDPDFASYTVEVARGDSGAAITRLAGPVDMPVADGVLAQWPTAGLPEGVYTLRLQVLRRDGRTVEERRRVTVDRTPPRFRRLVVQAGLAPGGRLAVLVEAETDDATEVSADSPQALGTAASDRHARVHGFELPVQETGGGLVSVAVHAVNGAGLRRDTVLAVQGLPDERRPGLLRDALTAMPDGTLLPMATDYDGDGLLEAVVSRSMDGAIGDTLLWFEWDGDAFRRVHRIETNALPRDAGDPDGDGRGDLLAGVAFVAVLFEASSPQGYPDRVAFEDTRGLDGGTTAQSFTAGRLTDLDGDGRGEIAGHNTHTWRFLEWNGQAYVLADSVVNPTPGDARGEIPAGPTPSLRNQQSEAVAAVLDLDGDGRPEFVTTDADGDTYAIEADATGRLRATWQVVTDRYAPRPRYATGDFDGDGRPDLVVLTQTLGSTRLDREQEPPFAFLTRLVGAGDDHVRRPDSLALRVAPSRFIALGAADLDANGSDELVVAAAPDLYVFTLSNGRWHLRYHRGDLQTSTPTGTRAPALVAADFDRDGLRELLVPFADGRTHRLVPTGGHAVPAPLFTATALDGGRTQVALALAAWDSVTVYGARDGAFERLGASTHDTLTVGLLREGRAALVLGVAAWQGGASSPLERREVLREGLAALVSATLGPRSVTLCFDGPLAAAPAPLLVMGDTAPVPAQLAGADRCLVATSSTALPATLTVQWRGVTTREGGRLPDGSVRLSQPSSVRLALVDRDVLGPQEVRLRFNVPLDAAVARDVTHYRATPTGAIQAVAFDPARPAEVIVTLAGVAVGATGLSTGLVVSELVGAAGEVLDPDGRSVSLAGAAADLSGVYAFPNPVYATASAPGVMIAGLPARADVVVLSPTGTLLRRLEERDADGGVRWDLQDAGGRAVPSGVYLVRVVSEGRSTVVKVAVVR